MEKNKKNCSNMVPKKQLISQENCTSTLTLRQFTPKSKISNAHQKDPF